MVMSRIADKGSELKPQVHVEEEGRRAVSARALLIGCIGIILFIAAYMRTSVLKMGYPVQLQYVPSVAGGAMVVLGLLANLILSRTALKKYLTQGELLVIYTMVMISSIVVEGLRWFYGQMLVPVYHDGSKGLAPLFERISPLVIPQGGETVMGFYAGRASVPWGAWILP